MKKPKPTKRVGMLLLAMCLLWLGGCKRNELQPPRPSVLDSYRGTDKIVLQVIETLKEPVNKTLLADLEKQGSIKWEYKILITSRFLEGFTLRFSTGSNGDYLDAEVNAETKMIKLYGKQQREQRDAIAKTQLNSKLNNNATLTRTCIFTVDFDIELVENIEPFDVAFYMFFVPRFFDALIEAGFQYNYPGFTYISEKTTAEVDELLRNKLYSFFRPGTLIAANFTYLEIENSCESVEGDNPNVSPILTILQTSPTVIPPYDAYGLVYRERVELKIGCYKDGGVWRAVLKKIIGYYSVQTRLLPGVSEITLGPTNSANFCKQVEDLENLGNGNAQWYTISAVQAHEKIHVDRSSPTLNSALAQIRERMKTLTVSSYGVSYSDALFQLNGMASGLEEWAVGIWRYYAGIQAGDDHAPGMACDIAERNVVDPIIASICRKSKIESPAWPSCTYCPN